MNQGKVRVPFSLDRGPRRFIRPDGAHPPPPSLCASTLALLITPRSLPSERGQPPRATPQCSPWNA